MHRRTWIHRDIKPDKLSRCPRRAGPKPKCIDFYDRRTEKRTGLEEKNASTKPRNVQGRGATCRPGNKIRGKLCDGTAAICISFGLPLLFELVAGKTTLHRPNTQRDLAVKTSPRRPQSRFVYNDKLGTTEFRLD